MTSSESTGGRRILTLTEAEAILREVAGEEQDRYTAAGPERRRDHARRILALEMGAQALAIAELEERRKGGRPHAKQR